MFTLKSAASVFYPQSCVQGGAEIISWLNWQTRLITAKCNTKLFNELWSQSYLYQVIYCFYWGFFLLSSFSRLRLCQFFFFLYYYKSNTFCLGFLFRQNKTWRHHLSLRMITRPIVRWKRALAAALIQGDLCRLVNRKLYFKTKCFLFCFWIEVRTDSNICHVKSKKQVHLKLFTWAS